MNQSINTDSKNSKESQQKYRLGTVSIKILGGLNRFYRRLTSPSASIMAQNIHIYLIYSCYLTYSAIANASDIVPTHFTPVTWNSIYFTLFTYCTYLATSI